MRVVHICQRDDPDTGGSLRVAEALVREQLAVGLDVWLIFLYGPPSHISEMFGARAVCLGLHSSRQAFRGVRALCKAIRHVSPDIIHSHDGIVWPRLAFLQLRTPVVMHSHLPVRDTDRPASRFLIKRTTKILVGISLHTIETWVGDDFPPSRIHYVPNGVDFDRFGLIGAESKTTLRQKLGLPVDQRLLLWVGRVHRSMKGSDRLERVAGLLPDDMVLVVVGNGPEYEGVCERCRQPIDEGKLIMVGTSDAPEDYYKAADEFLFTSHHEPFGLVILEAVASGLPIIAFPVTQGGGAVRLLKEFDAAMVEDAATDAQIQRILDQSAARKELVQANLEKVRKKYSWKPISNQVVDAYKIALNKKL